MDNIQVVVSQALKIPEGSIEIKVSFPSSFITIWKFEI